MTTQQRIERIAEDVFGEWESKVIHRHDFVEYIHRVTALAEEEANKWQPIETAPKDGTDILLWWPSVESSRPVIGWWSNYRSRWDMVKDTFGDLPPTHWQPLPEAPKQD